MGRPAATLTEHQKAEVETLAAVLTAEQMADYFGIGRRTFFAIMQREPDIAARYKRGKARAIGSIAQSLITKARSGDTASMIFFLKTQGGWRETAVVEHSLQPDGTVEGRSAAERIAERLNAISLRLQEQPTVIDGKVLEDGS